MNKVDCSKLVRDLTTAESTGGSSSGKGGISSPEERQALNKAMEMLTELYSRNEREFNQRFEELQRGRNDGSVDKGAFGETVMQMLNLSPMMVGALKARFRVMANSFDFDF